MTPRTKTPWQNRAVAAAMTLLAGALCPSLAQAHFILNEPASSSAQNGLGDPQKAPPCGLDTATPGTPTGKVTTYRAGQSITLSITETIYHPGHYRVAIAQNPAGLPAEPPVTKGTTDCGSAPINANPTLPVLADGVFLHNKSFGTTPQTMQIQLPAGFTCSNCTLQVIEFMSEHGLNNPGGCYYHHCATVNIVADTDGGVTSPDAGTADMSTPPSDLAAGNPPTGQSGGCSLGASGAQGAAPATALFVLLGLTLLRRRRAAILS